MSERETAQFTPIQINFNTYTPTPFGSQDINPTMTIEDGGNTLHLKGNSWKKISLPYTVTAYTVLEFDFKSPAQGEVHAIGFDDNESMSAGYSFQVHGTDGWAQRLKFFTYTDSSQEWKHYRIPVESFTGNMLYLVFINDHDVSNPTGESYFRNVTVLEESSTPVQPPVGVDFTNYTISNYSSQTASMEMTFEDNGSTLHMGGNGWQKIHLPYTVTTSTVLEFDFKSSAQGEVQGIGFDDNNSYQDDRTFQLYGTQGWGMNAFAYISYGPERKHFRIPVGKYYTGEMRYLFFANDHDISNPTSESYFRNITIYEGEVSLPVSVDFNQYALSPYRSPMGSNLPTINILDNGNTLHLSGNGWTQISMPVPVTGNTVLAFDFQSTAQGEVHGIGFDTDQAASEDKTFKLYGTQNYGLTAFNDYAASAPNWKHYTIPVGQYYTGQMLYLFFAHDHDVASPTAESYFRNVQIYNLPPTATPTATLTFTPTATSTNTPTNTSTPIPTNTLPLPKYGGSGICWASKNSWSSYSVSYSIDRTTIPTSLGWDDSIHSSAQTWNNVEPSDFTFIFSTTSSNTISYGQTQNQFSIAETTPSPLFGWTSITEKSTILNSSLSWDTNNTPLPNNLESNGSTTTYNIQNAMTHEFGHWLDLWDISDEGCSRVTMWHSGEPGEIKKITIENADELAINWQYP